MIVRDALYDFIETFIDTVDEESPLFDAVTFRNIHGPVDAAKKVVRVECFDGSFTLGAETKNEERNVRFTIQCWVSPDSNANIEEQAAVDEAADQSFEMSKALFKHIAANSSLNGGVCDAWAQDFETGDSTLQGTRRGVTFLDGIANQAS